MIESSATPDYDTSLVSIVIPALNEERTIQNIIERAKNFGEVIVVDDGSRDRTRQLAEDTGVKVISHQRNMGYSVALKAGYKHSTREVITIMDADAQMVPEELPRLVSPIIKGEADLVIGSKFKGKLAYRPGIPNYVLDRIVSLVLRMKYGIRLSHSNSGFRAFRRSCLDIDSLKGISYEGMVELDFIFASNHKRIVEVPRTALRRKSGKSSVKPIDGVRILLRMMEFVANRNPRKASVIKYLY